jgi:hypothetical protein
MVHFSAADASVAARVKLFGAMQNRLLKQLD